MKHRIKLLPLFLTLCMTLSLLSGFSFVSAESVASSLPEAAEEFTLPDLIEASEAEQNGYIARVKGAESDLSTFVFANADGTNTVRVFSHPVKYTDANGKAQDISLDIKASAQGGFETAGHEIMTRFGAKLSEGISLSYEDVSLCLTPSVSTASRALGRLNTKKTTVT